MSIQVDEFDAVGLGPVRDALRAAGLRGAQTITCHAGGAVLQTETADRLDERRFASTRHVERVDEVETAGDGHGYIVDVAARTFPPSLALRGSDVLGVRDVRLDSRRLTLSVLGPQSAVAGVLRTYEDLGLSPSLERLGPYSIDDGSLDGLTDRQRGILRTAFRMGYFEVPRTVTAADVAAEFDIGQSTVVEHLRRAERNLLRRQFRTRVE